MSAYEVAVKVPWQLTIAYFDDCQRAGSTIKSTMCECWVFLERLCDISKFVYISQPQECHLQSRVLPSESRLYVLGLS